MRCSPAVFLATLTIVGLSQMAFSQQPMSKGDWSYKNGKPENATFDYGSELAAEDIDRLSGFDSIARISMGYAGIDSEYVTIEGDLLKLGRLKNLEVVYLNKNGIVDDDLKFIALLPRIQELEFNAKNGEGGCTDQCADYLSKATTLRELRIYNGQFTDKFIDKITKGMPNLEELMVGSPELTDESLRVIAERCKKLKVLHIGSDHFTAEGLKHLGRLKNLKEKSVSTPAFWWANVVDRWLQRAEEACEKSEDPDAADRAFARLQAVYIQWGEIEQGEKITQRINKREGQVKAHIAIAKHYAEAGDLERCKLELNLAKPLAVKTRLTGNKLVEAYLQLAKSPALAISFMSDDPDDGSARKKLCQALARNGYLDEALKIADSLTNTNDRNEMKLTIAFAAAKAARAAGTERATQNAKISYLGENNLWGQLAEALYKKNDLEDARKYAARVSSDHTKRRNAYMRRIADNLPRNTPNVSTYVNSPDDTELPLTIALPSEDPVVADRILESVIADAGRNPVEPTEGQFGPWNQKFRLARMQVQYSLVAALYRKAGNPEQATIKMQLAEEAFQILTEEEKGFGAIFTLNELQLPLIYFKDVEDLRQLFDESKIPLLFWAADIVVPELLRSGNFEAAKKLAETTLSRERGFDRSTGKRSEIASCFIEAGNLDAAHEILNGSKPHDFTAAACENAGRALVKRDRGLLMQPKWQNGIGAFQRAYLCIGAAIMAKENSNNQ